MVVKNVDVILLDLSLIFVMNCMALANANQVLEETNVINVCLDILVSPKKDA